MFSESIINCSYGCLLITSSLQMIYIQLNVNFRKVHSIACKTWLYYINSKSVSLNTTINRGKN